MRKSIAFLSLAAITMNIYAANESDASRLVEKYSETIACQFADRNYQENQYKAVTVKPGFADLDGMGAIFVVYWEGDVGCQGGNGTIIPNFTVVEHSGFASAPPVVKTDYKFPELPLVRLTNISAENEQLIINGVTYDSNDTQHSPTKEVTYKLKLVDNEFIKQ